MNNLLLVFIAAGAALTGYATLIEPRRLVVRERRLALDRWPEGWPPLRIALVADLHVGAPHNGLKRLAAIVARVNAQRPDLIALLGDYVTKNVIGVRTVAVEAVAEVLAGLRAPSGVVAVLGNHDWRSAGASAPAALRRHGIAVLENEAVAITHHNRRLWIGGLADDMTRHPDIARTLAAADDDAPLIMLSHDPAPFAEMPARPLITFSGHTHGGQVNVPFVGALTLPGRAPLRWAYGHVVEDGRHLFVTGGIGLSFLPIRCNVPPEIVLATIGDAER